MKKSISIIILVLFLAGCAPTAEQVQKAIAQTQTAMPTNAPVATTIPTSIILPSPTFEATSTESIVEINQELKGALAKEISSLDGVQQLDLINFGNNSLTIEVKTAWESRDNQSDVSYQIIQIVSYLCSHLKQDYFEYVLGGTTPKFIITTYSKTGHYKYQSITDYDTCVQVGNKEISYSGWVSASNAGFK
jgi:multidrug efflux pump subunit AcrB